jgi:protein-L-isoaspartate O-methyltransferase
MAALLGVAHAAGREDERVLVAISSVPRSRFVAAECAELEHFDVPRCAPLDAIAAAAVCREVSNPLAEQLAEGAQLVRPLGVGGAKDVLFEKHGGEVHRGRSVSGGHFVHGFP